MPSTYEVKVEGKDIKRFIKTLYRRKIELLLIDYNKDYAYIKLSKKDYLRLLEIKTSYNITINKIYGLDKIKLTIKKHFIFFCCTLIGLFTLLFLTNIILEVNVIHSKKEIRDLIYKELRNKGINKYNFIVSFDEQEEIVKDILKNHKDKLEWMELERVGVKYIARVEERIINKVPGKTGPRHIVAKKDGIIKNIDATDGEIVKKINDYVKKGDIIVSGNIKKGEEIKNKVAATGKVYAETWYTAEVNMPLSYKEEKLTGKNKKVFSLNFFNKTLSFFDINPYKDKRVKETIIAKNNLLPIKLGFNKEYELQVIDEIYTTVEAELKAIQIARNKLLLSLGEEDKILSQKKLKIEAKNSTIIVTVFFKVYEDITSYGEIVDEIKNEQTR